MNASDYLYMRIWLRKREYGNVESIKTEVIESSCGNVESFYSARSIFEWNDHYPGGTFQCSRDII